MPLPAPPGPDPAADLAAAAAMTALAERLRAIPLPPAVLPGWSSLCAGEYTAAALLLHGTVLAAAEAAGLAGRP